MTEPSSAKVTTLTRLDGLISKCCQSAVDVRQRTTWQLECAGCGSECLAVSPVGCKNCGLPVKPEGRSSTGWTHDSGSGTEGWQGIRCPGMLCGAFPEDAARNPAAVS